MESAAVHKLWGSYRTLAYGEGYRVKELMVKPGGVLSLSRHTGRVEKWIIVSGNGTVEVGQDVWGVGYGDIVIVDRYVLHRMWNPNTEPVVFVEVWLGDSFSESDLERKELSMASGAVELERLKRFNR